MKKRTEKLEHFLELGGTKENLSSLIISGIALSFSIFDLLPLPFDTAWVCDYPLWYPQYFGGAYWP